MGFTAPCCLPHRSAIGKLLELSPDMVQRLIQFFLVIQRETVGPDPELQRGNALVNFCFGAGREWWPG